jgi:phage FluMu protein Com
MPREKPSGAPPIDAACDHCGGQPSRAADGVLRCACGSLLARYVGGRLELKCRRCKRTVTVPASTSKGAATG